MQGLDELPNEVEEANSSALLRLHYKVGSLAADLSNLKSVVQAEQVYRADLWNQVQQLIINMKSSDETNSQRWVLVQDKLELMDVLLEVKMNIQSALAFLAKLGKLLKITLGVVAFIAGVITLVQTGDSSAVQAALAMLMGGLSLGI